MGIAAMMRNQLAEAKASGKTPREWRVKPRLLEQLSFEAMVEEMERTSQPGGKTFLGIPISTEPPSTPIDFELICAQDALIHFDPPAKTDDRNRRR